MHNPLKRSILKILKEAQGPVKEYELHSTLGGSAFAEFIEQAFADNSDKNDSADLALFRKHFLIMNALYTLHDELLPQGLYLHISALNIQLKKIDTSRRKTQALSTDSTFNKLSCYYQDWRHFEQTNDKDVSSLLQQFWTKFLASEEKQQSLTCLGLHKTDLKEPDSDFSWSDIQQRYKQLCQQHHPDKGGDKLYFTEIRQAYDNLKRLYK
jgi:curved DNA-binding protein CbpA